ncbi:MAG: UDP-N-acetylglucosamine--LPS N-acetylglucosamine transferase [Thermoleophilia bacterium]|nr:UDP-N-acetylglucosamine--LPS N-acetylglucosamine transferase [Thermoleophilia bacterium]
MTRRTERPVLLVASSGGHLLQLLSLEGAWSGLATIWVSNDKEDARSLLAGERAHFLPGPYSRNVRSLLANLRLAVRLVWRERPSTVLTTGADIAVPFAWIGRLFGARVVYVESFTRIETVSLSCRMIKPVANRVYVQWPELLDALPDARFVGAVAVVE